MLGELAAAQGHSIKSAHAMAEVYNPTTFKMAKSAQDKRAAYLKEEKKARRENKGGGKV